jgi:hypothetical protein
VAMYACSAANVGNVVAPDAVDRATGDPT